MNGNCRWTCCTAHVSQGTCIRPTKECACSLQLATLAAASCISSFATVPKYHPCMLAVSYVTVAITRLKRWVVCISLDEVECVVNGGQGGGDGALPHAVQVHAPGISSAWAMCKTIGGGGVQVKRITGGGGGWIGKGASRCSLL